MKAFAFSMLCAGGMALTALTPNVHAADTELKVGDQAPNFTLQASDGKTYKLSDFKGKQAGVLAWFPKAFTQGCTIECKSLAANGDKIRKFNVSYFMISVDPIEENTKFAASEKADFPMLADPTKATATSYGVLNERGMASRWTFYIDKDGVVREIDKKILTGTAAPDAAKKLKELGIAAQ